MYEEREFLGVEAEKHLLSDYSLLYDHLESFSSFD